MQQSEADRRELKRTRTAKACMHCRRRRIKCTGESPCASCVKLGRACVYECGPKKPRISHKGVITTLKAENQRLRADLQGLRMFSGMAGVAPASAMAHAAATPKAEELPFVDAYFAFEEGGLFPLVGRARFETVLAALRSKKSGRGTAASVPALSREDTALYFAMLAIGASLRRQEVPSMSYAARVRTILSESFDMPSETMVRVALLLALLHGSMLNVAKEACYLSTALQMLAVLNRVTGKPVPQSLVATAGAMCSIADGPLPFTTPKDLECDDELRSLACLITQVAGVLMHEGDSHTVVQADYPDLVRACAKASTTLARVQSSGVHVPDAYPLLVHGLHALCLFRMGRPTEAGSAVVQCLAAFPASACASGPRVWAHPMLAFVLRHVVMVATTMGLTGTDRIAAQVHNIAMAWPRAAVYFRGLQNDLRTYDEVFRARVDGTEAGLVDPAKRTPVFGDIVVPSGGSPGTAAPTPATSAVPALSLRGDGFGDNFDMCFDLVDCGDNMDFGSRFAVDTISAPQTPVCASTEKSREVFNFVQMVTLALGKPFNTTDTVLAATAAPTRVLVGTKGPMRTSSPQRRATSPSFVSQATPASSPVVNYAPQRKQQTKPVLDCLALPDSWTSVEFLGENVAAAPATGCGLTAAMKVEPAVMVGVPANKARRNSLTLLCDADHDDLEELLFNLTPEELVSVSLS